MDLTRATLKTLHFLTLNSIPQVTISHLTHPVSCHNRPVQGLNESTIESSAKRGNDVSRQITLGMSLIKIEKSKGPRIDF